MTVLNLARGKSGIRVPLHLPASGSEVKRAFEQLQEHTGKGVTRIDGVISPVQNLGNYLTHIDISDPDERDKLNRLAEKIDGMSETEQKMFSCVLDARSINGLDDILTAADSLSDYIYHPQITDERELGIFLVENHIMDYPQKTWPYLDYRAIGIEYHAEHSGALTPQGYVVRRSEIPRQEQEKEPVFRALLWSEAMRDAGAEPYLLELPASSLKLEQARRGIGVLDFADVEIIQAECLDPALQGNLTMDYPDVEVMQLLGEKVQGFQAEGQINKFLAILAVEQPEALVDALELSEHLDSYSLFPDDAEAHGQDALKLNFDSVDDDLIHELDGFTDWDAYGRYMMKADGVRITEYGLLRREGTPFPDESMGQQMG